MTPTNRPPSDSGFQFLIGLALYVLIGVAFPRYGFLLGILLLAGYLTLHPDSLAKIVAWVESLSKGIQNA